MSKEEHERRRKEIMEGYKKLVPSPDFVFAVFFSKCDKSKDRYHTESIFGHCNSGDPVDVSLENILKGIKYGLEALIEKRFAEGMKEEADQSEGYIS